MNIKTGLKTMAVALPMAMAPMKSTAQNIAKETIPTTVNARLGLGYGREAFFNHFNYEPKIMGSINVRGKDVAAGLDASVGKSVQSYRANVGVPYSGKNTYGDVGVVARYQHLNPSEFKGVILESEVNSTSKEFADEVSLHKSKGFLGFYAAPGVKVGDVDIKANLEAGMASFADFGSTATVARADIPAVIKDERIVNRSNAKFAANVGVSVDADLDSGIRAGLEVNHATFDNSTSVLAKMTYDIDRLFKHKK